MGNNNATSISLPFQTWTWPVCYKKMLHLYQSILSPIGINWIPISHPSLYMGETT